MVLSFFRVHCHHDSEKREIYFLKGDYFEAAKRSIQKRYQLFPVWFTLSINANLTDEPMITPVWWLFRNY
jgi:alpha-glucosidase (family GH31 glycosyl hydrolase)